MDIYTLDEKKKIIDSFSPKTKLFKNSTLAFLFGGFISLLAELLRRFLISTGTDKTDALSIVGITFILIASILTSLGIFDKIARYAGAGTLVPITGFSNSVTSQAIDAKSEGYILGVGAKIFTVAGPVILYGISTGVVYGIVYFLVENYL